MDQPSDEPSDVKQPKKDEQPPQHEQPKKDGAAETSASEEKPAEGSRERHFQIGLREAIVAVIAGVVLIAVGIVVFHNDGSSGEEPPPLPRPSAATQAKDKAVRDAKGPVKERAWAPEALTFAEPFKLQGAGQPIPHNKNVLVSCKLYWPHPESVEEEGFWYRIITKPWKGLFSPANSFWNGDKPGRKPTHSTDFRVRDCHESEMPDS